MATNIENLVNVNREELGQVLPLDMPYVIFIDPCNLCNFKCSFCAPQTKQSSNFFEKKLMTFSTFQKIIDDLENCNKKVRLLRLYTMGEPLLNPNFVNMVKYAKEKKVADFIETVTNGSRFNPQLNQDIVDSGIDRVRVSIEALSAEEYMSLSNVKIDYQEFVNNIKDLYDRSRGKCEIYIKTVNTSVSKVGQVEQFHQMFGSICDKIFVENIAPVWPNFDELEESFDIVEKGLMGTSVNKSIQCCPFPFYGCVINPDGEVTACCADWERGIVFGNIMENDFQDIWGGIKMQKFWVTMLKEGKNKYPSCKVCDYLYYAANDNIDAYAQSILEKIK